MELEAINLGSISGVIVTTMLLIEILKKLLKNTPWFNKVPVWVYTAVISVILVAIANMLMKEEDGSPVLEGDIWKLAWAAIIAAVGSSGFYTWLRNPETMRTAHTMSSNKTNLILTPLLMLIGLTGCRSPETAIMRESLYGGTETIRGQHKDWASKLVEGGDRTALPTLTQTQYDNLIKNHEEIDQLVEEDRKNDWTWSK